ncbi:MAG: MBL fold metallo-hydrolase [Candidatus Aminicenantes bacterium]|nr:MBL fold metallo-hydrolase [Candidatus Aminicenantes bacterium]
MSREVQMKKFTCLFALFVILFFCTGEQEKDKSNLIQPEKWYSVHPRPIYSSLEKIGTFQSWFDVYKITEDTYAIYEPNQFEEAISYLALGNDKAALIDTGTGIGNIKAVTQELTDLPVTVILTHEHYDHVAGAYRFDEIIMYDNEQALQVLKKGRNNTSLQQYITEDYLWKPLPQDFDPTSWIIPSMEPTQLVKDGDLIDLGERAFEVIYTPGHCPGQMCLLDQKNRILFTGDHFFPGPLYAYPPDVNIEDYRASNQKLVQRLDEFDHLCSGHNSPWVKSDVLPRVSDAFDAIFSGEGEYSQDNGLRRYHFDGFDILIREDML